MKMSEKELILRKIIYMDEKDPEYVSTLKYFHSLQSQPERLSEMASKEDAIV